MQVGSMISVALFVSGGEIVVILLMVLLFFGAGSIPKIARAIGKVVQEYRQVSSSLHNEFREAAKDIRENQPTTKETKEDKTNDQS